MLFNDGRGYVSTDEERGWMTPVVFDNLIHKGEMPVTVGVFVQWGQWPGRTVASRRASTAASSTTPSATATLACLIEEILPAVADRYDLRLSDDPSLRAVAGSSSGGIAAFTAAWERPDAFRRVMSFIGSYVNLRGGQIYPRSFARPSPSR